MVTVLWNLEDFRTLLPTIMAAAEPQLPDPIIVTLWGVSSSGREESDPLASALGVCCWVCC